MSSDEWTHAICDACYAELEPGRTLVRVKGDTGYCCWCTNETNGGYYRAHPATMMCLGQHVEVSDE